VCRRIDSVETIRSIWTTFHACGTVVILNAMQEETVEKVAKAQAADFEAQVAAGLKAGTQEEATDTNMIGARNYGRWEIKYELKQPYIDPDFAVRIPFPPLRNIALGTVADRTIAVLQSNEIMLACVKCMMDTRVVELETFSTVVSIPGSPTMRWHRDDRALCTLVSSPPTKHFVRAACRSF